MLRSPFIYFTDSILRAPTLGCMFMCFAAALVGVIVFLRKQSLLGESLSHCSYPGVICGIVCAALFDLEGGDSLIVSLFVLLGAFSTALLGLWVIHFMENKLRVRSDSALCFVLSAFFGIGLTLASRVQFTHSTLYNQIQVYLYGQAATMTDANIFIYAFLSLAVLLMILFLYKELQAMIFDRAFAKSIGIKVDQIDSLVFILIVLAVVIGIRSVGIILMSAMLIAPPVAARQYTNKLYILFILAAIFGVISGFFGNYISAEFNEQFSENPLTKNLSLPTGPMIVLVATFICILSLLLAPERGLLLRLWRIASFRYKCLCENLLKAIWRCSPTQDVSFDQIAKSQHISSFYLKFLLVRLIINGWIDQTGSNSYKLTKDGQQWAAQIVRLHRLWEVYLADYLGVGAERVHRNAEEMEHILTPELEKELTLLLNDPKEDPHHQPIPPKDFL